MAFVMLLLLAFFEEYLGKYKWAAYKLWAGAEQAGIWAGMHGWWVSYNGPGLGLDGLTYWLTCKARNTAF